MNDRFGHHFADRPSHQLIVTGNHLPGCEGEDPKKIEFGYDTQQLAVFHNREGIEVMLLK